MEIIKHPQVFDVNRGISHTLYLHGENKEKIYNVLSDVPYLTIIEAAGSLVDDLPRLEPVDIAAFILTGKDIEGLIQSALLCKSLTAFTPLCYVTAYSYKFKGVLEALKRYRSFTYIESVDELGQKLREYFDYLLTWDDKYGTVEEESKPKRKTKKAVL